MKITATRSSFVRSYSGAKQNKLITVFAFAVLGLAAVGIFVSRVISSRLAIGLGLLAGISLGVVWIIALESNLRKARPVDMSQAVALAEVKRNRILRNAWLRIPFCLLIGTAFGYSAIAWGCAWLVNMGLGARAERVVVVTGWFQGSGKSCTQPEVDLAPLVASWNALCVNRSSTEPSPGARLRLTGSATFLGMNVENIYVVDAKAPAANSIAPPIFSNALASVLSSVEKISAPPKLTCALDADARKEVRVRHVHIEAFAKGFHPTKEATSEELLSAYSKIEAAHQDLISGESFETVFRKYSDPQKAGPDGNLGIVKRGFLPSEFDRVVFCIPKGEISPVFRTGFGFHVAQVLDVRY
jgi:hypothetical protein